MQKHFVDAIVSIVFWAEGIDVQKRKIFGNAVIDTLVALSSKLPDLFLGTANLDILFPRVFPLPFRIINSSLKQKLVQIVLVLAFILYLYIYKKLICYMHITQNDNLNYCPSDK